MEKLPESPKSSDPSVIPPLSEMSKSPFDQMSTDPESVARPKKLMLALAARCHSQAFSPLGTNSIRTWASKFSTLRTDTLPVTSSRKPRAMPRRTWPVVLIEIVPLASMLKITASATACTASRRRSRRSRRPRRRRRGRTGSPITKPRENWSSKPAGLTLMSRLPVPFTPSRVMSPWMCSRKPGSIRTASSV